MNMIAQGDSMYPTMFSGEKYIIDKSENYEPKMGDVVVYQVGQVYICHRIINILSGRNGQVFYKLKGDNCDKPDYCAVTRGMIVGKVEI